MRQGGLEEAAPLASPRECSANNAEILIRFRIAVRAPASLALLRWETQGATTGRAEPRGFQRGVATPLSVARKGGFLRGKTLSRKVFPLKRLFAFFLSEQKEGRLSAKQKEYL